MLFIYLINLSALDRHDMREFVFDILSGFGKKSLFESILHIF